MAGPNVQGQDRILGKQVVVELISPNGPIQWAECDSFDATDGSKTISNNPLGQQVPRPQLVPGGWKMSFKGAVVDGNVDALVDSIQQALISGALPPRFTVTETRYYYSGATQVYTYPDVALYGFKESASKADEAVTWDFSGECQYRNIA